MNTAELNALWGKLIVEELIRCGVRFFCVSPGSRSTPLTLAVAEARACDKLVHFDERAAAFHAIGFARATGAPAALVCTSGTAVANYLPAVVEASNDELPLVVLTADRPPELRDTGANQTINQAGIYGNNVRWFLDLPCPSESIEPATVLTTVDQAVYRARGNQPGPVHLNCMFREPLVGHREHDIIPIPSSLAQWRDSDRPYTTQSHPSLTLAEREIRQVCDCLNSAERGLLIAGRLESETEAEQVLSLARKLNWPVLADITSGLKTTSEPQVIRNFDLLLLSEQFAGSVQPTTILHFGGQFVSKRLLELVQHSRPSDYIHVSQSPRRLDPAHRVTQKLQCDPADFCRRLAATLEQRDESDFARRWIETSERAEKLFSQRHESGIAPAGAQIARCLTEHLPKGHALFSASSMPVRELNSYAATTGRTIRVGANRGASGIDGTIASATGFARGLKQPVTALVGDLATLHDINSFSLLTKTEQPVTLVILNNNGGGIFEFLPIAERGDVCEEYFVAPHGRTFRAAAEMFDLPHTQVSADSGSYVKSFSAAYRNALNTQRSSVIEVIIDRADNLVRYSQLVDSIRKTLQEG